MIEGGKKKPHNNRRLIKRIDLTNFKTPLFLVLPERTVKDQTSKCYLFLVILGDVAEELAGLPKQDVLLAKLFLQELLQHKKKKAIRIIF